MEDIISEFEIILENPLIALFAGIWVIGYLLKNFTAINRDYIPWIAVTIGIILGLALISVSVKAGVFGAAMAMFIIGGHSFMKHSISIFKK